jgi:hypothetical protein
MEYMLSVVAILPYSFRIVNVCVHYHASTQAVHDRTSHLDTLYQQAHFMEKVFPSLIAKETNRMHY